MTTVPPVVRTAGFWCSVLAALFSVGYMLVLLLAVAAGAGMPPAAPFDAAVSLLSLGAAPILLVLWCAVHRAAPAERRLFSQWSLAFTGVFAALTSMDRYLALVMVPQARRMGATEGLGWFQIYGWPSVTAAAEMLAWGFWLGLALAALSLVFRGGRLERALAAALLASGVLCMAGVVGQVTGAQAFIGLALLGWGPGMMASFVLLALWFRRAGAAAPAGALRTPAAPGAAR